MKTCEEMVNSLLDRREQFLLEQKKKRRTAAKITAAGGCCALAAVIGAGVWNSGMLREKETIVLDNSSAISNNSSLVNSEPAKENPTPQAPDPSSVIRAESGVDDNINFFVDFEEGAFDEFNGKRITRALSEAFDKHGDDSVFAVAVYYFPDDECADKDFVYNGKTLPQYQAEFYAKWEKSMDLLYLRYNDEDLRKALDQTSTQNTDEYEWAKERYDQAVLLIGEELLLEYIADTDKLDRDIDTAYEESHASFLALEEAVAAWKAKVFENEAERLGALGIYCELRTGSDSFVVFVTKDEFAELAFDNSGTWLFGLAQENERDVIGDFFDQ